MLLPRHLTNQVAMRSPRPVLTKPRAKKKEITISQMTWLVKAEKASENESVRVTTETVRARKAQAPTGRGATTSPVMVERKMARSCHACRETWTGLGMQNRKRTPMATEIARGRSFAPPPPPQPQSRENILLVRVFVGGGVLERAARGDREITFWVLFIDKGEGEEIKWRGFGGMDSETGRVRWSEMMKGWRVALKE